MLKLDVQIKRKRRSGLNKCQSHGTVLQGLRRLLHCNLFVSLSFQVWFQNRRSKERRMKQLSALGARRHAFFRGPRRMRPLGSRLDEPDLLGLGGYGYYGGMRGKKPSFYSFFFALYTHNRLSFMHRTKAYFFPGNTQTIDLLPHLEITKDSVSLLSLFCISLIHLQKSHPLLYPSVSHSFLLRMCTTGTEI